MKTVSYPAPCIFRPMTDDRLLAVAYEVTVYAKGAVKVFDVGSWKVRYDLATAFTMYTLDFPDNRRLAFSDFHNDTEKIRELESGKNLIEETCASAATVRKLISRLEASIRCRAARARCIALSLLTPSLRFRPSALLSACVRSHRCDHVAPFALVTLEGIMAECRATIT
jgi:hypothetical protein